LSSATVINKAAKFQSYFDSIVLTYCAIDKPLLLFDNLFVR